MYDTTQTPYTRMLAQKDVAEQTKEHLRVTCAALDMTSLLHDRTSWMQLPGGDNLWSSRNVAATRTFLMSSRPDGPRTFLRELTRNQGIDTAYLNAVDELMQELTHGFFSNRRCRGDVPGPPAPRCVLGYGLTVIRNVCWPFLICRMTADLIGSRFSSNL